MYESRKFDCYWAQTAYIASLSLFLSPRLKQILWPVLTLMSDENARYEVPRLTTQFNYNQLEWRPSSILHFLTHVGYLTFLEENGKCYVLIPNKEVRHNWRHEISTLLTTSIRPQFFDEMQISMSEFNTSQDRIFNERYASPLFFL
jgi:hypothetical protein